jgi:hypothetical protein
MSNLTYYLLTLLMVAVLVWQVLTGKALGTWWSGPISRQDNPGAYWFAVAAQGALLIAFLMTGKSWPVR